jgi:hypothetical protein
MYPILASFFILGGCFAGGSKKPASIPINDRGCHPKRAHTRETVVITKELSVGMEKSAA